MTVAMDFRARQELVGQLEDVTNLKAALWAFRLVDASLQITIGPDWLDKANTCDLIADIGSVLAGHLVPNENGKLISTLKPLT